MRIQKQLNYKNEETDSFDNMEQANSMYEDLNHSFLAEKSGTYVLRLESYFSRYSVADITLTYNVIDGDTGELDSFEKPRLLSTSGTEIFTLHANEDRDYFEVELQAGQALQVVTEEAKGISARLYHKNEETDSFDNMEQANSMYGDLNHSFLAKKSGIYVLRLESYFSRYGLTEIELQYSLQ